MKNLTFKELSERKHELQKFLEIAEALPGSSPCRAAFINQIGIAIALEKSGSHDLVDDMMKELKVRVEQELDKLDQQ